MDKGCQKLTGNNKQVGHLRGQSLVSSISDGAKQHHRTPETSCNDTLITMLLVDIISATCCWPSGQEIKSSGFKQNLTFNISILKIYICVNSNKIIR